MAARESAGRAAAGDSQCDAATRSPSTALHTVCEEARCPNLHDCWSRGTATFMVAGKNARAAAGSAASKRSATRSRPIPTSRSDLAAAVERMGLAHVVITVVNRDDLPDGGADHYKRCVEAVHERLPQVTIELLSSDLQGDEAALRHLLDGIPLAVFAHNVECVPRLDRAGARPAGVVRAKPARAAAGEAAAARSVDQEQHHGRPGRNGRRSDATRCGGCATRTSTC